MCVVLGPPGSGCSTFLKAIAGETNGIYVNEKSYFNYNRISAKETHTAHRGDVTYTAELDVHFPMLTVGETLTFASWARCRDVLPKDMTRSDYSENLRDVVMAMYGITHTVNTKVGNDSREVYLEESANGLQLLKQHFREPRFNAGISKRSLFSPYDCSVGLEL